VTLEQALDEDSLEASRFHGAEHARLIPLDSFQVAHELSEFLFDLLFGELGLPRLFKIEDEQVPFHEMPVKDMDDTVFWPALADHLNVGDLGELFQGRFKVEGSFPDHQREAQNWEHHWLPCHFNPAWPIVPRRRLAH